MGSLLFPNIVACFILRCAIYLPLIVGSAIDSKEGHPPGEGETHGSQHLQTSYHVSTPTAAFQNYDRTHSDSTHDTENLKNTDFSLHRRSAREDFHTKTDPEQQFTIEQFHRIFRKYLQLLPKSKHYSMGDDDHDESLDPGSNSPGRNNERDNNNNQSGSINVYIKGNVHIRGNVNIDTSGHGNGVRNAYEGQNKETAANHPIIVESETDFSDVVTIPRKTEEIVDQRQESHIVVPTKSSARKLRPSQTSFQPSD